MTSITPTGGSSSDPIYPLINSTNSAGPLPLIQNASLISSDTLETSLFLYNTVLTNSNEHPILPGPELSLSDFYKIVNSSIRENVDRQKKDNVADPTMNRVLNIAISQYLNTLYVGLLTFMDAVQSYNEIRNQLQNTIDTMNNAILTFTAQNLEDQTAINNLNDAINQYNSGDIDSVELAHAIQTYNFYKLSHNSSNGNHANTYNTALNNYLALAAEYNVIIQQLNAGRTSVGLPLIPELPTTGLLTAIGGLPNPPNPNNFPVANIPNTNPLVFPTVDVTLAPKEDLRTILTTYYEPLVAAFQIVFQQYLTGRDQLSQFYQLRTFLLPNAKSPYGVATITPNTPTNASTSTSGSTGAGVGNMLTSLFPGEAASLLTKNVRENVLKAVAIDNSIKIGANKFLASIESLAVLFGLDVLTQGSLGAAMPAIQFLSPQLSKLGPDSASLKGALSINVAANLLSQAGANVSQQAFLGIISKTLGGNFPGAQDLAEKLSAGFNLTLSQFALASIAFSLGIPGLVPQATSNLSELSQSNIQSAAAPHPTLAEVLQNPVSLIEITTTLAETLAVQGRYTNEGALAILDHAFKTVSQQSDRFATGTELRRSLEQQLAAAGLDPATNRKLVNQALDLLHADQRLTLDVQSQNTNYNTDRELRNQIAKEALTNGASRKEALASANGAINPFDSSHINLATLENSLSSFLINLNVQNASAIANSVASGLNLSTTFSETALRDEIQAQLRTQGVGRSTARDAALAADIQSTDNAAYPLTSLGLQTPLSRSELLAELRKAAINKFSPEIGPGLASELADRLADVVGGNNNSFINRANEAIRTLKKSDQQKSDKDIVESFRTFMQPNVDLYTFTKQLMDPANTLVLSVMTGLMYASPLPSNYDHSRGMMA